MIIGAGLFLFLSLLAFIGLEGKKPKENRNTALIGLIFVVGIIIFVYLDLIFQSLILLNGN